MMRKQNWVYHQQGFTLIELLLALGISAVIAVLSYQSINSMVTAKQLVNQKADELEQVQQLVWNLQQDLVQLVPRAVQDQLGEPLPALKYRVDTGLELTRIAQFPTPNASGGLLRVGYLLENGGLYRLTWPVLDRAQDTQANKFKLLDGVSRLELRFLDSNDQWKTSWPSQQGKLLDLPKLTEIRIESKQYGLIERRFMGVH